MSSTYNDMLKDLPEFYFPSPDDVVQSDALADGTLVQSALERGRLARGQEWILMLLRYSEKMDMGTFFIFLEGTRGADCNAVRNDAGSGLRKGAVLLRCKPARGGKVVVWDAMRYGVCDLCNTRLGRVQVCADW